MAPKLGFTGNTRDLGIKGSSPGKGDKNRVSDDATFKQNYDGIDWGTPLLEGFPFSFNRVGTKLVKKYK